MNNSIRSIIPLPLLHFLRKVRWRYFPRNLISDPVVVDEISQLGLTSNDVVIDCGANIGRVAQIFATTGAKVYAFEPNPHSFWVLKQRMKKYPNVMCIQSAVSIEDGYMQLYMHVNAVENPVKWGEASSLIANKSNVDTENYVDVKTIDFAKFIVDLNAPVAFIKMDIECYEYTVIRHLIESNVVDNFSLMRIEPHDCDDIQSDKAWVEGKIEKLNLSNKIRFDWH